MTGEVVRTGEIRHGNGMMELKAMGFTASVDNVCRQIRDVHSLCIVPLFGHPESTTGKNLVGILQLINKTHG